MYNKDGDNITITLDDDVTINLDSISSNTGTYSISTANSIDISNIVYTTDTISTITLDDTHWADSITWEEIEFEDRMPSVAKVEDMCNDYPALKLAYENFKTMYSLVHQDWKGRQEKDV